MTHERPLDGRTLVAEADAELAPQARALLVRLAAAHDAGPPLGDGATVDFGWSRLTLRAEGDRLVVCEPDFDGDALRAVVPRVNRTLWVARAQAALLARTGLDPEDARYDRLVTVEKGALAESAVFLERRASAGPRDTGWFLGRTEGDAELTEDDLDACLVAALFRQRPGVMDVLACPTGTLAVFRGDRLQALFDADGTDRLSAHRP